VQETPIISIVDDDESVRVATEGLVRSLGFVARTFDSAEAFLRSNGMNEADCLIVDVQMPKMSGLELQRALRARGCRTPIIFVTAFPEERYQAQAFKDGAIGFLSKPFDSHVLIGLLTSALSQPTRTQ
jgi:FixJ family two-component response regulator